jgi:hypothetical protein
LVLGEAADRVSLSAAQGLASNPPIARYVRFSLLVNARVPPLSPPSHQDQVCLRYLSRSYRPHPAL